MERKAVSEIMLILLLLSMLTLAPPIQLILAEPETILYIDPSETKVSVGNTFIIEVILADVIDLYGYDIWLSYNTSFLDVISVDPPHLLPEPMIEIIEPDGIIHIYKILFPPELPVSGSGTLASITFNATAPGNCILDLFDTMLVDPHLSPIPHTVIDGSVTVLSMIHDRWAVIEDVKGDRLNVETASDEIWSTLVELYHNRSERWIGGIVEEYDNVWGFRFDPNTIIVAENVIEVWQTTIRGISEGLDYWLGNIACVGAKVVEINPLRVPDDYPTIQGAINAASDGGTILVASGTHYENVIVNKTVSLIGENKSTTIIDGGGNGTVVSVTANNVTISEFTIENGGSDGILLDHSNSNTISENVITNNYYYGIMIWYSGYNTLRNNVLTRNGYNFLVYGNSISDFVQDIDVSNKVDGKTIYYWVNQHNRQVPVDAGYVSVVNSTNITVKNLNLTNNGDGVQLAYTTCSTVENVTASDNFVGVHLIYSSSNLLIQNKIVSNDGIGIRLYYSTDNTVITNALENNANGIISWYSGSNEFSGNIISNWWVGIGLRYSDNNAIFHNSFINNTEQASLIESFSNTWDDGYPSGGNYWSDYTGVDLYHDPYQNETGSDGIGDTPYIIAEDNQDNYPLMSPYEYWSNPIPGDINKDMKVDYKDLFQLTAAYGSTPEKPNWNPHADLNNDVLVDCKDLFLLSTNYGKEWI